MIKRLICIVGVSLSMLFAVSDEELNAYFNMSIEELLNTKIEIASYSSKSLRDQPGIVTVITRNQIENSGARDLIDILNLVPGFTFAGDVLEVVGIGMRGIWANEGKILLIVDGIEWNESLYGTLQFGKHFSADLIRQIEIIRGPGSAMYGGSAELAVIKITTIGDALQGAYASATASWDFRYDIDRKYDVAFGDTKGDLRYSASIATQSNASRSNETLHSLSNQYDMSQDSRLIDPLMVNLGLSYRGLSFRYIRDEYKYSYRDYYDNIVDKKVESFDATLMALQYQITFDNWSITPKIMQKIHPSWHDMNPDGSYNLRVVGERLTGSLIGQYTFDPEAVLSVGLEAYSDKGTALDMVPEEWDKNVYFNYASSEMSFWNVEGFMQFEMQTPFVDFTAGGRYAHHESAGEKLVPRLGLTKTIDDFHAKLLYSQAYRTPNVAVINYGLQIGEHVEPEATTAYEMELGYKLNDRFFFVINGYLIKVDNAIYYSVVEVDTAIYKTDHGYLNGGVVSTAGTEAELRYSVPSLDLRLGYSYYRALEQGIPIWASSDPDKNIGMPTHKITYDFSVMPLKSIVLNANGFYTSSVYGFSGYTDDWVAKEHEYDSQFILNCMGTYTVNRFKFSLGVSDLLGTNQIYPQAYDNWSGAVPANGREYIAKVSVQL